MEGGKKCFFVSFFLADQKIAISWKKKCVFGASYKHEQQVVACCQTHADYGPPKMPLKVCSVKIHKIPL